MRIINPNFDAFDDGWWDRLYRVGFHSFNEDDKRKFALIRPLIGPEDSVVDFGFGEGYFVSTLPNLENRKVTALEWSDVAIEHGKLRYPTVKFVKKDFDKPFTIPGKYDFGVCCEVLEHLKNPGHLVKTIMSKCKRAVVTLPDENFCASVVQSDKLTLKSEFKDDELDYHYAAYTREDISAMFGGKVTFIDYPNHIVAYYES